MAFDQVMKDKIKIALQDKRNGNLQAIYQRIHKYGTPFKTFDKRYKYGTEPTLVSKGGVSRQLIRYRIKKGWDLNKAQNYVKEKTDE